MDLYINIVESVEPFLIRFCYSVELDNGLPRFKLYCIPFDS